MGRTRREDFRCEFHFIVSVLVYGESHFEQKHGLRPLPTAEYPDLKEGVTLKCTKKQEAVS